MSDRLMGFHHSSIITHSRLLVWRNLYNLLFVTFVPTPLFQRWSSVLYFSFHNRNNKSILQFSKQFICLKVDLWKCKPLFAQIFHGSSYMINSFLVNNQKAIMGFCKVLHLNYRILPVVFFYICFELFGYLASKDCCFRSRISFCQQHQNTFVNIVVNQNDWICSFFDQLWYKLPGIENLAIEEDTLSWFKTRIDNDVKFLVVFVKFFSIRSMRLFIAWPRSR